MQVGLNLTPCLVDVDASEVADAHGDVEEGKDPGVGIPVFKGVSDVHFCFLPICLSEQETLLESVTGLRTVRAPVTPHGLSASGDLGPNF